jgi:glycosyltransferase involved in cell wall biosynthesis
LTPDITVVIPNFNGGRFLSLAMESALHQTLQNLEIIVIDDGSKDDSVVVVERVQKVDPRVRLFIHKENRGVSAALNTGIQNSDSNFITFLGSDDLFAPERCQVLCAKLKAQQQPCVIYSDSVAIDNTQTRIYAQVSTASYRPEGMVFNAILTGTFRFTLASIAVPRHFFDMVGLYDESLRYAEDLDMVLRLSARFPFYFERLSTYGWRVHQDSSSVAMARPRRMSYESKTLERHLLDNLSTLDSKTKRKAFNRLLGCYVGSGQWMKLVKISFVDLQAFLSMITIPTRARRFR